MHNIELEKGYHTHARQQYEKIELLAETVRRHSLIGVVFFKLMNDLVQILRHHRTREYSSMIPSLSCPRVPPRH